MQYASSLWYKIVLERGKDSYLLKHASVHIYNVPNITLHRIFKKNT